MFDTVRFWIREFDIDGIRLDCADVLDFDFQKELRWVTSQEKQDFWLMGEVIHGDYARWANQEMLHSVTNYELNKGLWSGHNDHNYFEIAHTIRRQFDENGGIYRGRVLYSFGGYARAQLSRLDNKAMRNIDQPGQEEHILQSVQNAYMTFPDKYFSFPEDAIRLYIDDSDRDDMVSEIFMDVTLKHYPLRDYKCMWSEMHNIVKDYGKIGKRAKTAMRRNICKHAMHLVRLQNMCLELMETGTMHTYRRADHDFLMDIRNGRFTDENDQMTEEFFRIVEDNDNKIREAAKHTVLPAKPDYRKINDFICEVNEKIIKRQ